MNVPAKSFEEIFESGLWEGQQKLTDRTLQTDDGTTFRIHRVILTQRSGYFRALFSFNLNQEMVVVPKVDSKILDSILLYIYTGTTELDEKNVWNLMITSDYLLLDDLMNRCRSFVIQHMTSTNCLSSLSIAWKFERLAITEVCYRYALVHFEDVLKTQNDGFEDLPFEILKKLLESNSLNVISEISVWKAIVSWTKVNYSLRLPHIPALLTCLRLEENVDEDLSEEILSHAIISSNPHCFDLMQRKQFNYHLSKCKILSQYARFEAVCYQNSPWSHDPRVPNCQHFIARHTLTPTKYGSELFLTYDNELDFWRKIGEIDCFIDTMVQIGEHIYMFDEWQNINFVLDIVEEAWLPMIQPVPSSGCSIVTLGEKLYSIGGIRNGSDSTDKIFKYEFERNRWEIINMAHRMIIYGAVTLKAHIFVVGLRLESTPMMMCQAYDPLKDTWIFLPPPNVYRRGFFAVAFHDQIFVIAGVNDEQYLKTVEVYDPAQNTWMFLPDLPFEYLFPGAVIVDDKIIVYENNTEDGRYQEVSPPVYWDEGAHLWRIIDESSPWYHIERYSFLVLDDFRILKDLTAKNRRPGNEWERIFSL